MFRKRHVPTTTKLSKEGTFGERSEDVDTANPVESLVKKSKFDLKKNGILIKEEEKLEKASIPKSLTLEEVFDGTELEAELERRKQEKAVVTIDSADIKKPTKRFGPTSAPAYLRAATIIDYKPDLCKDYNQTGYCGYGDSCIYLHDRTTYVSGNVLDQRWDEMQKKEKESKELTNKAIGSPTICGICKETLHSLAVKTRCGHNFCKDCAFKRFETQPSCAVCGLNTQGIFNDFKD